MVTCVAAIPLFGETSLTIAVLMVKGTEFDEYPAC
jgi:hypothetical protein